MSTETLPQLFLSQVRRFGTRTALREKELGIWREISWNEYLEHVRNFSLGLVKLGLERGEAISILSENNQQWLYADLATQAARAMTVGVYPTNPPDQVRYVLGHSRSRFVVVGDQEQADKVLEVFDDLPDLKKIIVIDVKGLRRYETESLVSFDEVEKIGAAYHRENP
ncbi:MAG: AMP-binding protein, partial [Deltaproteobacteria bacterium]